MEVVQKNHDDTDFLRFIAILLIINSHLDKFYPISILGTGGAIGNALFFALSAFGLTLSSKKKSIDFVQWYSKRIVRLFPSVWVTVLLLVYPITVYTNKFDVSNILPFLGNFFFPPYWFLQALLIFYMLGYFLITNYTIRNIIITISILIVSYIICYLTCIDLSKYSIEKGSFSYFICILTFIFGILLAKNNSKIVYVGLGDIAILMLSTIVIYGHKYMMTRNLFPELQFIQQLMILPVIYYSLKVSRSPFVLQMVMQSIFKKAIVYISGITLELYMVHSTLGGTFLQLGLDFPVNVVVFLLCSFLFATLINVVADKFIRETILSVKEEP